jgi:membrane-associated protease RseP (regulator of RpoE activity)
MRGSCILRTAISTSIALVLALGVVGCVYPRRGTSLSPVTQSGSTGSLSAPPDIYQLTLVDAQIAPRRRGDLPWDDGGNGPDTFVRVFRDDTLIFESPVVNDTLTPTWDVTLPENVRVTSSSQLRFELWDSDTMGADPVGQVRTRGLPPNAVVDAPARLLMENGTWLTVRINAPRPHRGAGIAEYEVRPDALVVLRVLAYSPAARAGLVVGDAIVGIGERRVSAMSDGEAASALSMSAHRDTRLIVRGADGRERTVELDRGFVWLTM